MCREERRDGAQDDVHAEIQGDDRRLRLAQLHRPELESRVQHALRHRRVVTSVEWRQTSTLYTNTQEYRFPFEILERNYFIRPICVYISAFLQIGLVFLTCNFAQSCMANKIISLFRKRRVHAVCCSSAISISAIPTMSTESEYSPTSW